MALVFGGRNTDVVANTEEYDGTSWTGGGNLNTAKIYPAGVGTQTAGLGFSNTTEEYNGTSWTTEGNLGTARAALAGCGTQTAGLAFGGSGNLNTTEEYTSGLQTRVINIS